MRLLTKITLLYLLTTFVVLAIGGVLSYYFVKNEIDAEQQRFLRQRLLRTIDLIKQGETIGHIDEEKLIVVPLGPEAQTFDFQYKDTLVYHNQLQRMEPHSKVSTVTEINDKKYYLATYDVIVEGDDIVDALSSSFIRIYLLLLLATVAIGALFSANIFRPFDHTLQAIQRFRLRDPKPLELEPTSTREFARLNDFIRQMTTKSRRDYQALKEFSENASHEMQTPLAIAGGKLQLLLDSPNLSDEDFQHVVAAQQSIHKLSKLGQSLALLTRIDNEEFSDIETIDFSALVQRLTSYFEELAGLKNLTMTTHIEPDQQLQIDPTLADVLVTNLLQNAVRHNEEGGSIDITLVPGKLTISNTGKPPQVNPSQLFQRFRKGQSENGSFGLGLAIVKRICERNNLKVDYRYQEGRHVLEVSQ